MWYSWNARLASMSAQIDELVRLDERRRRVRVLPKPGDVAVGDRSDRYLGNAELHREPCVGGLRQRFAV